MFVYIFYILCMCFCVCIFHGVRFLLTSESVIQPGLMSLAFFF